MKSDESRKSSSEVAELFSAIARRDPSKRQIKPVSTPQLSLLDEWEDESDSEFVCDDPEDSDDADESVSGSSPSSSNGESSGSSDDVDNSSGTSSCDEAPKPAVSDTAQSANIDATYKSMDVDSSIECTHQDAFNVHACPLLSNMESMAPKVASLSKPSVDLLVCLICLGDNNDPNDELIECDGCGIVVHEDCYKVIDSIFLSSGASSSSTDAWFCEPCLAGEYAPHCELCPSITGAFKRTDNNRWVHLLCALYTPGVAFNDPENLMDVTLTELAPKVWSMHECSLCDERFFAWTGVCISCDAGLCRTFFHVTCAQKHGLLSEPVVDENAADPYFAHCRQHTDKTIARQRRRNYLTAASRLRSKNDAHTNRSLIATSQMGLEPRLQRKLEHFRTLYLELLSIREKPYGPCFLVENGKESLGLQFDTVFLNCTFTPISVLLESACDYFFDSLEVSVQLEAIIQKRADLRSKFLQILLCIQHFCPELKPSVFLESALEESNRPSELNVKSRTSSAMRAHIRDHLRPHRAFVPRQSQHRPVTSGPTLPKGVKRTLSTSRWVVTQPTPTVGVEKLGDAAHVDVKMNPSSSPENVILGCSICNGLQDQHLITKCDTCGKGFHLACLDPPLLRMPKRTRLYGWQCSYCTKAVAANTEVIEVDVNAPRQLRRSMNSLSGSSAATVTQQCNLSKAASPESKDLQKESSASLASELGSLDCSVPSADLDSPTVVIRRRGRPLGSKRSVVHSSMRTSDRFRSPVARSRCCPARNRSSGRRPAVPHCKGRVQQPQSPHSASVSPGTQLSTQPTILVTQLDQAPRSSGLEAGKFDAYEYVANVSSDDDLSHRHTSKVIKFVQIRDHNQNGDSDPVEQIAPLHMRYMICRDSVGYNQKKSIAERFRMRLKKL
ncbi:unnamed protein product [Dicrocoelium dendriticum]|nr:unnamed protein product [Dicrocoelium dendriticum]